MNDDTPFFRAILANPGNEMSRLVYADWLEERGDPRGEFLRLDVALVKLSGDAGEYPQMRDRWLELRRAVDDKWAQTLSFRPIANVEGLVHFLREFHRGWIQVPALDLQTVSGELPYGLALVYRELGQLVEIERNDRTPFAGQDGLVPLSQLARNSARLTDGSRERWWEFAWENQGNWSCRCPFGSDPPVYCNSADVWETPARGFQVICQSLNHFLITFCLHEAVFSAPCLTAVHGDSLSDILTVDASPLWVSGQYVETDRPLDFFAVPEADAIIMNRSGWWLASHADEILRVIKKGVTPNRIS